MSRLHRYRAKTLGRTKRSATVHKKSRPSNFDLWFSPGEEPPYDIEEENANELAFKKWKKEHQYPNFKPNDWTDCYKMPLHADSYGCYAWTADDTMALSSFDESDDDLQRTKHIIGIINGDVVSDYEKEWSASDKDPCAILYKGEFQFLVRGWGHLTGCGWALNLPPKIAAEMQDGFIKHIISKLNGD